MFSACCMGVKQWMTLFLFCVFLLSWLSSTLVLGLCATVCAPPPSPPPTANVPFSPFCPFPLLFSSSQCGVSGWVLQCCRLICKYTHLKPNTNMLLPPFPSPRSFFFPALLLCEWFCMLCPVMRCTEPSAFKAHSVPRVHDLSPSFAEKQIVIVTI